MCPRPLRPSWLTSIIFSSIHLVIHVHGKFLKKPVAELEAHRGTQALSGQPALALSASSGGCHKMGETACVPCATQPPTVSGLESGVWVYASNSSGNEQKGDQTHQVRGGAGALGGFGVQNWGQRQGVGGGKGDRRLGRGQVKGLEKGTRSEKGGAIAGAEG